ncbi:hypothetical protein C6Y62_14720 [Hyphomicrobium sulfonivorans]|nr:hypothetical protein [Hyphomicrobium sulfonivorans]
MVLFEVSAVASDAAAAPLFRCALVGRLLDRRLLRRKDRRVPARHIGQKYCGDAGCNRQRQTFVGAGCGCYSRI